MASSDNAVLDRLNTLESEIRQILSLLQGGGGSSSGGGQSSGGSSASATVSDADWKSLGDKLDQFEQVLSPKEKAVLMTVLGAAAATYSRAGLQESPAGKASIVKVSGNLNSARLSDGLKSIGSFGSGISTFGGGAVEDSVGVGGDFTSVHADWSKDLKGSSLDDSMVRGQWNALAAAGGLVSTPGIAAGGAFGRSGLGGGGFG